MVEKREVFLVVPGFPSVVLPDVLELVEDNIVAVKVMFKGI